jgi:aryl-alcohol dehydrogenase-like predicted oxidoreductase
MLNHKEMEYRRLGNTGLKVSALGFGNMVNSHVDRVDIDDSIVKKCLEKGINFFDTAEAYSDGKY